MKSIFDLIRAPQETARDWVGTGKPDARKLAPLQVSGRIVAQEMRAKLIKGAL